MLSAFGSTLLVPYLTSLLSDKILLLGCGEMVAEGGVRKYQ